MITVVLLAFYIVVTPISQVQPVALGGLISGNFTGGGGSVSNGLVDQLGNQLVDQAGHALTAS